MTNHRKQFVSFSYYKLAPDWRRQPLEVRQRQGHEFLRVLDKWNTPEQMSTVAYSLMGLDSDADFMLWRVCYSLHCLQDMTAELLRTEMGAYLTVPNAYLGMARRSSYALGTNADHPSLKGTILLGRSKYLFVYPLSRTREWYQLAFEVRQRMVHELANMAQEFPETRTNFFFSFGMDDQEYIVAMETDNPEQIVERAMRSREIESATYIRSDSPVHACVRVTSRELMEKLGA